MHIYGLLGGDVLYGVQIWQVPVKCWHMSTKLHDIVPQKTMSSYFPQQERQSRIFKVTEKSSKISGIK